MAKTARGLTISQRPNGAWRAQIRKVGFPYESRDFLTHEDADAWGLHRLGEIQSTGRLVDRRLAERVTLAHTIEVYRQEVTSKRPGEDSRMSENARLDRFLREEKWLCGHALAHLTSEHFEAWRDRRLMETPVRGPLKIRGQVKKEAVPAGRFRRDGTLRANAAKAKEPPKPLKTIAPGTVKRELTLLKRICDFALQKYKLAANPLDRAFVERPEVQDDRKIRISGAEWERLLAECRKSRNIWLAPFVEVALEIGTRRGSSLKLRWDDVHLDTVSVTLRGVKNSRKPSEIRTVEIGLSPRAVAVLGALPRSLDGRVFPVAKEAIKSGFERARHRAQLDHFRLHDARHELASRLVEAGWGILDIMSQGDWRDPKSVARYYTAKGEHLGKKLANPQS
jgi:integrase